MRGWKDGGGKQGQAQLMVVCQRSALRKSCGALRVCQGQRKGRAPKERKAMNAAQPLHNSEEAQSSADPCWQSFVAAATTTASKGRFLPCCCRVFCFVAAACLGFVVAGGKRARVLLAQRGVSDRYDTCWHDVSTLSLRGAPWTADRREALRGIAGLPLLVARSLLPVLLFASETPSITNLLTTL